MGVDSKFLPGFRAHGKSRVDDLRKKGNGSRGRSPHLQQKVQRLRFRWRVRRAQVWTNYKTRRWIDRARSLPYRRECVIPFPDNVTIQRCNSSNGSFNVFCAFVRGRTSV